MSVSEESTYKGGERIATRGKDELMGKEPAWLVFFEENSFLFREQHVICLSMLTVFYMNISKASRFFLGKIFFFEDIEKFPKDENLRNIRKIHMICFGRDEWSNAEPAFK